MTEDIAHEIWAAAQLIPGEGINDGVQRIVEILTRAAPPASTGVVIPGFIPEGWTIEPNGDALIVWHPDIGGYAATEKATNIAATILYSFVRDLLAAPTHDAAMRDDESGEGVK